MLLQVHSVSSTKPKEETKIYTIFSSSYIYFAIIYFAVTLTINSSSPKRS